MDIDGKILKVKELIAKREEIDAELASLFGTTAPPRKVQKCTTCGEPGHTARTCRKDTSSGNAAGLFANADATQPE